jgi:hypothetical protein
MGDHFIFRLIPYLQIIFEIPCRSSNVPAIRKAFTPLVWKSYAFLVSLAWAICAIYCNFLTPQTNNIVKQTVPNLIFCIPHFLYSTDHTLSWAFYLVISVFLDKIHCLSQDNSHAYPELLQSIIVYRHALGWLATQCSDMAEFRCE